MFPAAAASIANWAMLFGVIGILYGAVLAYGQTDLKRLIAYTSVSHMGFILLGVFSYSELAMQGVVLQMLAHGLSTGALFVVAGMLKERLHTRDIEKMGGLWKAMPSLGGVAMVFTMASLGLPAMGNFIAEFLILLGAFNANPVLTAIACVGLVLAALYSLRFMQKVFFGPQTTVYGPVSDLNFREAILMTVLVAGIILLGIYPQPVINMAQEVIAKVMSG
jgi:NADH-quinone oxidoreductase subunit M